MTTAVEPTRWPATGRWVAYVGPFPFPWGQAASRRVLGVAQAVAEGGRTVVVVNGTSEPADLSPVPGTTGAILTVGAGELPAPGAGPVAKVTRMTLSWGRRTARLLQSLPTRPSHVVVYGGLTAFAAWLHRWGADAGVPVLHDVVEWYDPRQLTGGRWGPLWWSSELALRRAYPRAAGIIAISSYLHDHYATRGVPTVTVPPVLDTAAVPWREEAGAGPNRSLIYFGVPGPKDLLGPVVRALDGPLGRDLRLTVVGPEPGAVLADAGLGRLPQSVQVLGRLPQPELTDLVRTADASLVIRPDERFTRAGFPTKFVESLACGTPVLGTLTSDLARYLVDGRTGLVLADTGDDAAHRALSRLRSLGTDELTAMRRSARRAAEQGLDYRGYVAEVADLLERSRRRR